MRMKGKKLAIKKRASGVAKAPLIILSGPSGCGKTTVIDKLLARQELPLRLSVSATTRSPRQGEQDGVAYHFWNRERFEEELKAGGFIEHAEVHGNYYGTLGREVEPYRERGIGVLLDIDVQGFKQVRQHYNDYVSIFLHGPSLASYEERLRKRGTEDEAAIRRRLNTARKEITQAGDYQHQIVNDDLDNTVEQVLQILKAAFRKDQACSKT